ncbi:MAG TPA: bifunctional 5,10-methylenetetrahydrofolate dehydrogenase/5,10-methenyltetrahydrofolate cyclohydrolase [Firmicutes bacterium]|nr:bifunctional 5,10-methylenetetrahydrofolate dehydrogenase/5,10-methenyltetrahydrofolate cyclohydrolase [Bacillota bacterium]
MSAKIIKGEQIAREMRDNLKKEVASLKEEKNITPGLAVIVVKNPLSRVHVARLKERTCRQLGIKCQMHYLPGTTTVEEVISLVKKLNFSEEIHGINIHPFTDPSNQIRISQVVDYNKDVEGLHFLNMGRFLSEDYEVAPFMAKCIMKMIEFTGEELKGKKAVIIGRSRLLDIPLSLMLLNKNATVTICHPHTADLSRLTKDADILVAAAGHPQLVKKDMVKEGAIVIDAGENRVGTRLIGDVDYVEVEPIAGWITPVPGGVGPVNIAMLLDNLVKAVKVL